MTVHPQNYVIVLLILVTMFAMSNHAVRMPFALQKINMPFVNVPLVSVVILFQILAVSQLALAVIALPRLYVKLHHLVMYVNVRKALLVFRMVLDVSQSANAPMEIKIVRVVPIVSRDVVLINVKAFVDPI